MKVNTENTDGRADSPGLFRQNNYVEMKTAAVLK